MSLVKIEIPEGKSMRPDMVEKIRAAVMAVVPDAKVSVEGAAGGGSGRVVAATGGDGRGMVRKTRINLVNPDSTRKAEDGWVGFNIRWLIDDATMGATLGSLGYATFPLGSEHKMHAHDDAEEFTIYLRGKGVRVVGGEEYEVGPGDVAFVPRGVEHGLKSVDPSEPIELWCFYAGAPNVNATGYRLVGKH
ncbi:MAG: cupin domain-containing protein [Bacillota bacterium]